jgi:hypothetical protein
MNPLQEKSPALWYPQMQIKRIVRVASNHSRQSAGCLEVLKGVYDKAHPAYTHTSAASHLHCQRCLTNRGDAGDSGAQGAHRPSFSCVPCVHVCYVRPLVSCGLSLSSHLHCQRCLTHRRDAGDSGARGTHRPFFSCVP